ncbi:hypothetical protein EG850_10965 [Gulosibacter macacae]|uniref:DUF3168 domain-containing protein n=1 Tax=Gulosibacter macacae TaxID=2488791 RepID=A0A3P3VSX8_9MICO|nr:hypothetical protein [Gulosibacter macacae]RRJ85902.1 hypothetical protein EG850_10965 [Gulosibacter macacae]
MKSPDVKAVVMAALRALDVRVVSSRPDDGTKRFVRVVGTGGPGRRERIMQVVQLTISAYDTSTGRAASLAADVDALIRKLPSDQASPVSSIVWATTPQELPDPDTGSPRSVATYQLTATCR